MVRAEWLAGLYFPISWTVTQQGMLSGPSQEGKKGEKGRGDITMAKNITVMKLPFSCSSERWLIPCQTNSKKRLQLFLSHLVPRPYYRRL